MATLLQTGQVKTNSVGLAYARQTALGAIPTTGWRQTEPNGINTFGASITTVARAPISKDRQDRKGTVTDLDSAVEFDADTTMASFTDFIAGYLLVDGINADVTDLAATGAETTGDTYTGLTALNAAQAAKFPVDALVWVQSLEGGPAANTGLKSIAVAAVDTDTALDVNEDLVDDAGAYIISVAGFRIAASDAPTWTWDAGNSIATLAGVAGLGTSLLAQGVIPGMTLHVGSVAAVGDETVVNAFENAEANDMFGYARVRSIAADVIVFDKVGDALQFTDADAPATPVDLVFGQFYRNVPVDSADFCEIAYTFEGSFPGLGNGTPGNADDAYQYALDNFANTLAFNLPLTDKATATFAFVGTDTNNPTTTRAAGAGAAVTPVKTAAFNTSTDLARLRIQNLDDTGLTTDFKSLTFNINNGVTPEKVLGRLGARFINFGNFQVRIEAQLLFTNPLVVNAIRNNTTLTMDWVMKNDDGTIAVDVPAMTLGGGDREYPVNESVLINTEASAFRDPTLGYSLGVSISPVPLP